MFGFLKNKEIKNYAKLIDEKLNEGKEYFLEVLKKKNTIYGNDVENYLKKSGGRLDTIQFPAGKIGDLQSQRQKDIGVWFNYEKLDFFTFILDLKSLPKEFSLQVMGLHNYEGFSLMSFSNENKIRLMTGNPTVLTTRLAKKLNDELSKISNYDNKTGQLYFNSLKR